MNAPRELTDAEKDALALRMAHAMLRAGRGVLPGDAAFAVLRAAAAMLYTCATPGREAEVLRVGIAYLRGEIELIQAGLAPPRTTLQ